MGVSYESLVSPALKISLAAVAIAIILLAADITISNEQQQLTGQQAAITQNPTLFQSARDSFRVQVPQGWVIHDVNNTGFILATEVLEDYGILAQLCPEGQQAQQAAFSNVSTGGADNRSCQQAREELVHVIRYPNLGARLGLTSDDIFAIINRDTIPNAILAYQTQKLQEAGYRDIQIVNSTDTTINVDISTGLNNNNNNNNNAIAGTTATTTTTRVPAKLVAMTYSTNLAPNETRIGYFILTATAATPRNLGMITGYSIFYEGNSVAQTVSSSSSVAPPPPPTPFPAAARQIFGSFELIAAPAEPLTVEITSSDTEGQVAPATFDFEANVTGGMEPYTIRWDFDDGDSDEEESDDDDNDVDHTFDVAGTYTVSATVTDSTGRTVSDSILITVEAPPPLTAVEIISSDTQGVVPATFDFEANVTGGTVPYTYSWDFGDGSIETDDDETVDHTFDVADTYNVDLTVTDSTGRTVSDSILITVEAPPPLTAVEIISSDTQGVVPATFDFEANVTGGTVPYTYSWDFGDGSIETDDDETVDHTFDVADTYNVDLTVTDSTGRTVSDSILITVEAPPPLTAVEIISSDTQGVVPATFDFEANVTGGTVPYTYSWDFGDGSIETDDDETVDHTFDVADTYNVDLTVTDSTGRTVSDSILITVEAPPPLTAVEIISSDTQGVVPATFDFEANVTGGTVPYTYSWDFGDGSIETDDDETVDHTFDVADTYNVDLTVTDSTGRTVSDSILITVEAPPPLTAVEIISSDTQGVVPATFDFEANVTGGTVPYTYSWDFGDGSVES